MISLRDIFKKNTGFLRALKASYFINNLLNAKKLRHNKRLYKKFGVGKSIFAPIGSKDFGYSLAEGLPWLDVPGAKVFWLKMKNSNAFRKKSKRKFYISWTRDI